MRSPSLPGAILVAIAMISATGLAAEIILMRIFSIIEWHQFAWMIISLALLGFGASGTLLALLRGPALRHDRLVAVTLPSLTAVSLSACLGIATRIDWRSLELLWSPSQVVNLLGIYLLLAIPFCCIGTFIGLTFMRWPDSIGRLYGADLAGAAAGAVTAVILLGIVMPGNAWKVLTGSALVASAILAVSLNRRLLAIPLIGTALVVVIATLLPPVIEPGEYKGVSQALRVPEATVTAVRSTPLGYLQLLESDRVPPRLAPGLSLNFFEDLPPQRGIFIDGEGPIVLNDTGEPLHHIEQTTFGLPLRLLGATPRNVVVTGAAGLPELVRLAQLEVGPIHLIEEDSSLIEMISNLPGWGGEVIRSGAVTVLPGTLRSNLPNINGRPDLIFIPFAADAARLDPASDVTRDSFGTMLGHLAADGIIAISAAVETPPRTVPQLLTTIAEALERKRLHPVDHVAAIRAWDATTIVISRSPLDASDRRIIRDFADEGSFDLIWVPGMDPSEANRFNQLDQPWHHDAAREILTDPSSRARFISRYKFDVSPITDDRPWFGTAMKWRTLAELLALRGEGGASLIRSGYPILLLALAQALIAGILLILAPLAVLRRPSREAGVVSRWRVIVTFAGLGLAFLFIEIVYIHRLTILLGRPLESVTIVLASFLLFSGLGSLSSTRLGLLRSGAGGRVDRAPLSRQEMSQRMMVAAPVTVAVLALVEIPLLALAGEWILQLPHAARILASVVTIAPLAFAMGIPFPTALEIVRRRAGDRWVAWAWGINGCASVVSAVLAVLLAIHVGLTAVTVIAAMLYVTAGVAMATAGEGQRQSSRLRRV